MRSLTMSTHYRSSLVLSMMSILMAIALLLTACGSGSTSSGSSSVPLKNVSVGLSYNPDIQFAPFYVALSKGYYKAAGLNVTFNQVAALTQHRVDAVMGYSNSQPLQIESNGMKVRTFDVSDYLPLVSNGIITTQQTSRTQSGLVRGFVQATLKGLRDVINDPNNAVQISKQYVPGMNAALALEVLKVTIPIYRGDGHLGYNDSKICQSMEQFLLSPKLGPPA